MIDVLFSLLLVCYVSAFAVDALACSGREARNLKSGLLFEIGFLLHTFFIFAEAYEAHVYLALTTFREVLVFFAWALAFVYLVLLRRLRQEMFGLILLPFLLIFLLAARFLREGKAIPVSYFDNPYFLIHILSAFFAYASFTLSFVCAALYLIQSYALKSKRIGVFYEKLPPLRELERLIFHAVGWGIFLLSIGITSGLFWSKNALGTYWVAEPKSISSVLTCGVYALALFLQATSRTSGKKSVTLVVFAFALVLFTFVGTSLLKTKLHVGI